MDAYPDLTQRVRETLAAAEQADTAALNALYWECFGERCHRRARILHKLQQYLTQQPAVGAAQSAPTAEALLPLSTMATSENFRFKKAFEKTKAIVHTPKTRAVTAQNLTDADVPVLQAHSRGHLVEVIPGREKQAEEALKKLAEPEDNDEQDELPSLHVNKPELQKIFEQELGRKPSDSLTVEELRKTIQSHRDQTKTA